jgi:hypothetical protein
MSGLSPLLLHRGLFVENWSSPTRPYYRFAGNPLFFPFLTRPSLPLENLLKFDQGAADLAAATSVFSAMFQRMTRISNEQRIRRLLDFFFFNKQTSPN